MRGECLAISALSQPTLVPMIERIGEILARDLVPHYENNATGIEAIDLVETAIN